MQEILGYKASDVVCAQCGKRWSEEAETDACPGCGGVAFEEAYPEIPNLEDEPLLALLLAAESQIPRTQDGAILHREMVAWLRFHGVRSRAEMLTWEWFFREIGGIRARLIEEVTAPSPPKGRDEEGEE